MKKGLVIIFILMVLASMLTGSFALECKGDINQDGQINQIDYLLLKKHLLGLIKLTDDRFYLADMNNDGIVDIADFALLRRAL
jgi:hypothetical protein